jgi:hypothetical protein
VLRAVREASWTDRLACGPIVFAAGVLMLCWVWAIHDGWDGLRSMTTGVPGTVAIQQCENGSSRDPYSFWTRGWSCTGTFTADHGAFRVGSVRLYLHGDVQPGPVVTGRASGPDTTTVWADGEIGWLAAVVLAVALPFSAWWLLRQAVEVFEPLDGWPKPLRTKPDRSGQAASTPQTGNRARKRRPRKGR